MCTCTCGDSNRPGTIPILPKESSRSSQPRSEGQAKRSLPSPLNLRPKAQQPQPPSMEDEPKRFQMAYDMGTVRRYYHQVHKKESETPPAVREDEECDLKVIYEILSKEGYKNQAKLRTTIW
ncbi:unnamed protein product [Symbiodinium pilosum]|uniref:Uncharacterized protein n=1 Tax=Symbiodinium pilosum TaxID=2952 RepID=A0A812JRX3_SYMPI|nr:unnamed protein product [Symbiodinium pilosum]